jgi:HK97 family phage major capsid protein
MSDVSANSFPILFGDLRRAYMVLDRVVIEVLTDPYSGKATGMVEFSARKRVGGQVVLAEAVRVLKIAA